MNNDVVLLAEKGSNSWKLGKEIQEYLSKEKNFQVPLEEVQINEFRNGEIDIHAPYNLRQKQVYFIQDSNKNPQRWWVELILIQDLLKNSSAAKTNFVLPNLLYSRKDRKDMPRVPISARAVANSISHGIDRLITIDMHSEQIQSAYPANVPIDSLQSFPYVVDYLRKNHKEDLENLVIVSPDAGGVERAKVFLEKLNKANQQDENDHEYSFAMMSKIRHEAGKVGEMNLVGNVEGKNVLIVDDIIDSGGTQCKAADVLKQKGAKKVLCYGTHGIFTKGTAELKKRFDSIITSNTHYQNTEEIEIVDITPLLGEAIYRNHFGESISELFELE